MVQPLLQPVVLVELEPQAVYRTPGSVAPRAQGEAGQGGHRPRLQRRLQPELPQLRFWAPEKLDQCLTYRQNKLPLFGVFHIVSIVFPLLSVRDNRFIFKHRNRLSALKTDKYILYYCTGQFLFSLYIFVTRSDG